MSQLQANPDSPDLSQLKRRLLPEELALVPRYCAPIGRHREPALFNLAIDTLEIAEQNEV
jgi:hypothetical protein